MLTLKVCSFLFFFIFTCLIFHLLIAVAWCLFFVFVFYLLLFFFVIVDVGSRPRRGSFSLFPSFIVGAVCLPFFLLPLLSSLGQLSSPFFFSLPPLFLRWCMGILLTDWSMGLTTSQRFGLIPRGGPPTVLLPVPGGQLGRSPRGRSKSCPICF